MQAPLAVRGFNKLSVAIADTNLQLKVTPASCFLGFAHAGKMDAHRLSTGQALTKDLAIKDTSLTKSLLDKLQTRGITVTCVFLWSTLGSWSHLRRSKLFCVDLHQLTLNHASSFNSCYYFLTRTLCSGIQFTDAH